jgi:hypothetical protein
MRSPRERGAAGTTIAHRLHAAGDGDVDVADLDSLIREHHGLQTGPADLVDRERGDVIRQAAVERRLPRRVLPEPGRDDVAYDALVDDLRIDARAAHGFGHRQRAELGRRETLSAPRNLPVGVRTAETMTDSRTANLEAIDRVGAEERLEALQDHGRRAHDLARPHHAGGLHEGTRRSS